MRASMRDVVVITVLLVAALLVRLAWQPLGPWVSLAIAFGAGLTATAVYRVQRRPRALVPPSVDEAPQQVLLLRQD
jgi:hypothetical protein